MTVGELDKLVGEIRQRKAEGQTIEVKSAQYGCPESLFDTLSSFSNQSSGGTIIFGLDEHNEFELCGVYDAQDLQHKVTQQCNQMEPVVRALFTVTEIEGKTLVSAEIPSVKISLRPVHYKGAGIVRGSFVRVGDSDEHMTEYEVYNLEAFRERIRNDARPVNGASPDMLNNDRVGRYLESIRRNKPKLAASLTPRDILERTGVVTKGSPTIAGLMVFSDYPQQFFPQLCITAIRVPGTMLGAIVEGDGRRFIDNRRLTGPISDMLEEAVEFVRRNSRVNTSITAEGRRVDKTEYPLSAVREAVLNALVHRDYSSYTENTPIRIEMYEDRLEVINEGGLFGDVTVDELGHVMPETRNPLLANMLEDLNITENRYSGIPAIFEACKTHGIPPPVFVNLKGEFRIVFRNSESAVELTHAMFDPTRPKDSIVAYCRVPRSRSELVAFTGMSHYYTMSEFVLPLVAEGKLLLTIPEKPRSSHQRFFSKAN